MDLCNADSDGDGKSNGEELGDPNCVWVSGKNASLTKISLMVMKNQRNQKKWELSKKLELFMHVPTCMCKYRQDFQIYYIAFLTNVSLILVSSINQI